MTRAEVRASQTAGAFTCTTCDWAAPAQAEVWCCPRCGSPIDFAGEPDIELSLNALHGEGFQRYAPWLGLDGLVSIGESRTPLFTVAGPPTVNVKNEASLPTGSFKDRGAATLISWFVAHDASHIVVDSSGNAGSAIAAYAARAGIECEVHVPAHTSVMKVSQARAYGAHVVRHEGPRAASSVAAQRAAETQNLVYASQIWHPAFVLGVQTLAFELWEQLGATPDALVMPLGAGTLLLGIARGFQRLQSAGLIGRVPRLIGVQASNCAPIAAQFGFVSTPSSAGRSIAEGIQVADPPRASQIIAAIKQTAGTALAVDDDEVTPKIAQLAREGVLVEPTSAVGFAGLELACARGAVSVDERVVVISTGSGLKTVAEPVAAESGREVAPRDSSNDRLCKAEVNVASS